MTTIIGLMRWKSSQIHNMKSIIWLFVLTAGSTNAQNWLWLQSIRDPGAGECLALAVKDQETGFAAGLFSGTAQIGTTTLISNGEKDLWLLKMNPQTGATEWTFTAGGPSDEEVSALTVDHAGNVLMVGAFWQQIYFDNIHLEAFQNTRALFIAKISPEGNVLWAEKLESNGIKKISDVGVDASGQIYLGGYFQGQLSGNDWSINASGTTDLFLLKLNPAGEKQWVVRAGQAIDTRITSIAVAPSGQVIAGGFFNGITSIGSTVLTANTFDRDVFLAAFDDTDGSVSWARKAGGVHDDELTDLAIGADGTIFATGYLIGVMNLGNNIAIQSSNGNPDWYILKYNNNGEPLDARAMGGLALDQSMALVSGHGQVFATGFFQGLMVIDGKSIDAGSDIAGFLSELQSEDLTVSHLEKLAAPGGGVYPAALAYTTGDRLLVGGSFQGTLQLGNQTLVSTVGFDGFIAARNAIITSQGEPTPIHQTVRIYPQPARSIVYFDASVAIDSVQVFSLDGVLLSAQKGGTSMTLNTRWPSGEYLLLFKLENDGVVWQRLIISR